MDRFLSLLELRSPIARLIAGFAALLLTLLILGIHSVLTTREMSRQAAELHQMDLLGSSHLKEANIDMISTGRALRQMVLAATFVDRDEAKAGLDQAMHDLEEEMTAARPSIFRDQERLLLNEFELQLEHYKRNVDDAVTLINGSADYQAKATAYVSGEQFNQVADSADQLLHRMAAIKEEGARGTAAAMARHSRDTQMLTSWLLLGGMLFGMMVGILIGRSIKKPADHWSHNNRETTGVDDTIQAISYRDEPGVEEQSMAMSALEVGLVQAEDYVIAENVSDDMLAVDEQSTIILPEPAAINRDEERFRERFESVNEPPVAPPRRVSVLIVEDKVSNQEVSVGLVANTLCEVTIANSGQQALELLEKSSYDVVLMNMQLMTDGINAALEIRKNRAFDRLSIIAMTAGGIHQDREYCLAAGMNGHIVKPIHPDRLFRALMSWVSADTQNADNHVMIAAADRHET